MARAGERAGHRTGWEYPPPTNVCSELLNRKILSALARVGERAGRGPRDAWEDTSPCFSFFELVKNIVLNELVKPKGDL